MKWEDVSADGIHLAGSFQNWDPATTALTHQGGTTYSTTVNIPKGDYIEYKFINGTSWDKVEAVPSWCGLPPDNNRHTNVNDIPVELPTVCFSNCSECPTSLVDVTFKVDISGQTVSPDGVHIAGNFQNWDPSATLMTSQGGNIYSYTTILMPETQAEYKFINGSTWDQVETIPESCGIPPNNNRYLIIESSDMVLDPIQFGTCVVASIDDPGHVVNRVSVYPNPTIDFLYLETPEHTTMTAIIFATDGQIVKNISSPGGKICINIGNFKPGIYFIKLIGPDSIGFSKVVKE